MQKRLVKTGNSLALVLDRELLEKTGITGKTKLEISTDGDLIVISPVRESGRSEKLRLAMGKADDVYGGVFRRLAE